MSISEKAVEAACEKRHGVRTWRAAVRSENLTAWVYSHRAEMRGILEAALPLHQHPDGMDVNSREAALWSHNMRLKSAIEHVRAIIKDGALTGFNCKDGDWPERLFASQAVTHAALAAAPPAPVQEDRWQPIETAPLDGTAIWLLVDGRPYLGYGETTNWLYKTDQWFVKATFRRRDDETRHRDGLADEIYCCHGIDIAATHWQPLPIPPALIAEKDGGGS